MVDAQLGDTNLAVVKWSQVKMLADEYQAREKRYRGKAKDQVVRLDQYERAVRANRQLAVALQSQGLNEDAARFAYRAQILQRKVFWMQREAGRWLFSLLLALLAGYGYRLWRILAAYLLVVSLCTVAYFTIGMYHPPHLTLLQAFLESITALILPISPPIALEASEHMYDTELSSQFLPAFHNKLRVFLIHPQPSTQSHVSSVQRDLMILRREEVRPVIGLVLCGRMQPSA